jgi:hypothetical protein
MFALRQVLEARHVRACGSHAGALQLPSSLTAI